MKYYVVGNEIRAKGTVPKTRMAALRESIAKWRFAASLPEKFWYNGGIDGGPTTCALCRLYFRERCEGCPVKEETGYSNCDGTPYTLMFYGRSNSRPLARKMLKLLRDLERKLSGSRRRPARTAKKVP
jgi:hypothetical protein